MSKAGAGLCALLSQTQPQLSPARMDHLETERGDSVEMQAG